MTEEITQQIGMEHLPEPILEHMKFSVHERPILPHIYHVTELLYCLRKAFFRRRNPDGPNYSLKSLWNIYRGRTFDNLWSPLFRENQQTYTIHRNGVTIIGTFDFLYVDQKEKILYDLKMPASTYYKKQYGAGQFYHQQVQAYLAMAHQNGNLKNVQRGRILMLAEDLLAEDVAPDPKILKYLWKRAFKLDHALTVGNPAQLTGPEADWECKAEYCESKTECEQTK